MRNNVTITLCGSLKFHDKMQECARLLRKAGHTVFVPVFVSGVDYWSDDGAKRIEAKKGMNLIKEHFEKINTSDAILVINVTKRDVVDYIGANTFLEIGYAHYLGKTIYLLNDFPDQPYLNEELRTINPVPLRGDLQPLLKSLAS